jgi:putative toxin of predicted polymorphic toxin system/papain fold toxin 1 (glutamine deamidase) of polymorphic toxin system
MRRWRRRLGLVAAALGLALLFVVGVADTAFAHQCSSPFMCFCNASSGTDALKGLLVLEALSFLLSMIPYVGWVKGVIEAGTGEDLITGRKLSEAERALGAIPWGKLAIGAGAAAGLAGAGVAASRRAARLRREADIMRRVDPGDLPPPRTIEESYPGLGGIRSVGGNDCSRCAMQSLDAVRGRAVRDVPPEAYRGMSPAEIQEFMSPRVAAADRGDFYWRSVGQDMNGFDALRGRQQIVDALGARPNGSQALVRVMYDDGTAHVLSATNRHGEVVFLDRQAPGGTWMRSDWLHVTDATVLHVPDSYFL